jgi:hypothetical protein
MSRTPDAACAQCRTADGEVRSYAVGQMSPTWIWMQVAIVIFVVIGMIIAITKLA